MPKSRSVRVAAKMKIRDRMRALQRRRMQKRNPALFIANKKGYRWEKGQMVPRTNETTLEASS